MNEQTTESGAVVRHSVTVPISDQQAFELFTARMDEWWPKDTHSIAGPESRDVIEPRVGGRWYTTSKDGKEHDIGRVLEWEPPRRVLIAWQLAPDYEFDPDPAKQTEVEVTFDAEGGDTRVTLEHRGFEVYGEEGEKMRESVGGEGGWSLLLDLYAKAA